MPPEKSFQDLSAANVIVEVRAGGSRVLEPNSPPLTLLEKAIKTTFEVLAVPSRVRFESIALVQELADQCTTSWLRASIFDDPVLDGPRALEEAFVRYLAEGSLTLIGWMNQSSSPLLLDLQMALRVLILGEVLKSSVQPSLPKHADLVTVVAAWQNAKNALKPDEKARILFESGSAELDLSKNIIDPTSLLPSSHVLASEAEMILIVETPDYSESGKWQLRHGRNFISATMSPSPILDEFYRRELDIRPGDGLKCRVRKETRYGEDSELIDEQIQVIDVLEVIPASSSIRPKKTARISSPARSARRREMAF